MIESLNRVVVSRSALRHNFSLCRHQAANCGVMAMVKADGYGHGMEECGRVFADCGAAAFGVAEVVEGIRLRRAGVEQPIFVLAGIMAEFFDALFEYDLTPVLVDGTLIQPLAQEAVLRKKEIAVHLKVDAGMGRQGFPLTELPGIVAAVTSRKGLRLQGIMAHFPMADDPSSVSSDRILADFLQAVTGLRPDIQQQDLCLHIANSGGLFSVDGTSLDMVRPGISLYGYGASGSGGVQGTQEQQLIPAMRFVSRIIQVREVPAGTGLGYGHIFTTDRTTRLAVLPVGYEDGYLRVLSNRARVLLHGRSAPVVGRISMNLTLVDVTDLGEVQVGDEAVLLGRQGREAITANEIAGWMETISYEVLCLLGHCNRIEYVD
ncbi:MAG: alanine racemase [Desulfobulbaceae bacterium]|nr:alanine racemase [Desulfobulbaceae bacterium]